MEVEPESLSTRFEEKRQEFHFGQVNFEILKQVKAEGIDQSRNHQQKDLFKPWRWFKWCCYLWRECRGLLLGMCLCIYASAWWNITTSRCHSHFIAFDILGWVGVIGSFVYIAPLYYVTFHIEFIFVLVTPPTLSLSKFLKDEISSQNSVPCLHIVNF